MKGKDKDFKDMNRKVTAASSMKVIRFCSSAVVTRALS